MHIINYVKRSLRSKLQARVRDVTIYGAFATLASVALRSKLQARVRDVTMHGAFSTLASAVCIGHNKEDKK